MARRREQATASSTVRKKLQQIPKLSRNATTAGWDALVAVVWDAVLGSGVVYEMPAISAGAERREGAVAKRALSERQISRIRLLIS